MRRRFLGILVAARSEVPPRIRSYGGVLVLGQAHHFEAVLHGTFAQKRDPFQIVVKRLSGPLDAFVRLTEDLVVSFDALLRRSGHSPRLADIRTALNVEQGRDLGRRLAAGANPGRELPDFHPV